MSAAQSQQTAERYGDKNEAEYGKKVVTFGEIMLRLAPEGYYRFTQAECYGATYGGGEANVAVFLANFGFKACFVTKIPAHDILCELIGGCWWYNRTKSREAHKSRVCTGLVLFI